MTKYLIHEYHVGGRPFTAKRIMALIGVATPVALLPSYLLGLNGLGLAIATGLSALTSFAATRYLNDPDTFVPRWIDRLALIIPARQERFVLGFTLLLYASEMILMLLASLLEVAPSMLSISNQIWYDIGFMDAVTIWMLISGALHFITVAFTIRAAHLRTFNQ